MVAPPTDKKEWQIPIDLQNSCVPPLPAILIIVINKFMPSCGMGPPVVKSLYPTQLPEMFLDQKAPNEYVIMWITWLLLLVLVVSVLLV